MKDRKLHLWLSSMKEGLTSNLASFVGKAAVY